MDLSKAEQIEIDAYRQRYNHLHNMGDEKQCGGSVQPIPEFHKAAPSAVK